MSLSHILDPETPESQRL